MGCKRCDFSGFNCISILISIVIGVLVGILFSMGLIPVTLNFIKVALVMSAIGLAVLLAVLLVDNLIKGCSKLTKCICTNANYFFAGIIGTFLSATAAATAGLTITSLVSAIFVGLTAFFFTLMIIALIILISCIICVTCKEKED